MMLYHFNLGFPFLSPVSKLISNTLEVKPRDAEGAKGIDRYAEFQPPTPGYAEQVFYHDLLPDAAGFCTVALMNSELGLGFYVRSRRARPSGWGSFCWQPAAPGLACPPAGSSALPIRASRFTQ